MDSFEYKIGDGHCATARATVSIRICASVDATCDGFDDDCDGLFDEDGSAPSEVTGLVFPVDPQHRTLTWSAPAVTGGGAVLYDVIRSGSPGDFVSGAVCVESNDGADTSAIDPSGPPDGGMFAYVVRAGNSCGRRNGREPVGRDASDRPRLSLTAPGMSRTGDRSAAVASGGPG